MDTTYLTIAEAAEKLRSNEISSVELTQAHLERIDALNGRLNAFISVTPDVALLQAREADGRFRRGEAGPLMGIPMALKDILSTRGLTTTCGSKILESYVPQYSATVVERLEAA